MHGTACDCTGPDLAPLGGMVETSKPREVARCPRCGEPDPNALGRALSTVLWFACSGCAYVWGDRDLAGSVAAARVPPSLRSRGANR